MNPEQIPRISDESTRQAVGMAINLAAQADAVTPDGKPKMLNSGFAKEVNGQKAPYFDAHDQYGSHVTKVLVPEMSAEVGMVVPVMENVSGGVVRQRNRGRTTRFEATLDGSNNVAVTRHNPQTKVESKRIFNSKTPDLARQVILEAAKVVIEEAEDKLSNH